MTLRWVTMVVGLLVGVLAFVRLALAELPPVEQPVALHQAAMHCDATRPAEQGIDVAEPGCRGPAEAKIELVDSVLIFHGAYAGPAAPIPAAPIPTTIADGVRFHHDPVLDDPETIVGGMSNRGPQLGTFYLLIHLSWEKQHMRIASRLSMDIHTAAYAAGEPRGMIVPARAATPLLAERRGRIQLGKGQGP